MHRSGGYGSAETSFPGLYPLLTLLPRDLLVPDPNVVQQLLDAVLLAWAAAAAGSAPGSAAVGTAAVSCFVECWGFVLAEVRPLLIQSSPQIYAHCDQNRQVASSLQLTTSLPVDVETLTLYFWQ